MTKTIVVAKIVISYTHSEKNGFTHLSSTQQLKYQSRWVHEPNLKTCEQLLQDAQIEDICLKNRSFIGIEKNGFTAPKPIKVDVCVWASPKPILEYN